MPRIGCVAHNRIVANTPSAISLACHLNLSLVACVKDD